MAEPFCTMHGIQLGAEDRSVGVGSGHSFSVGDPYHTETGLDR